MVPKFSDYLSEQMKKYMMIVVLSTILLFFLLTGFVAKTYNSYLMKNDRMKVKHTLDEDYRLIREMIEEIDDHSKTNVITEESVKPKLYDIRKEANIKFNFSMLNRNLEIIATNLYPQNQEALVESHQLQSAIRQIGVLHEDRVIEESIPGYSESQMSAFTMVIKGLDYIYVIEPLYSSLVEMEHHLNSSIVLTDRYDNVLFDTDMNFANSLNKFDIEAKKNYLLGDEIDSILNFKVIKRKIISFSVTIYALITALITLFVLVQFLAMLNNRLSNKLQEPLDELLEAIEVNKNGNLDYYLDSAKFLEFDKIHSEFNELMFDTKLLMLRNSELLQRKKEMEMKHLKNQFNPHFIYNTLESIRYEIIFNPQNASKMLLSLGRLMQYSTQQNNDFVHVFEDISYIEDYLRLQKMRFKDRLNYNIRIDEEVMDIKIPKLTLQPLIENSIKHNMEHVEKLNVFIEGTKDENNVYFTVKDDGIGITSQELEIIEQSLSKVNNRKENIGLYNIDRTIKLLYGDKYGINLNNSDGLIVTIKLPKESDYIV